MTDEIEFDYETMSKCERCNDVVIKDGCFSQIERHGKIKARAYYCKSCATLLNMVGAGEQSDMHNRQIQTRDNSPETKSDF